MCTVTLVENGQDLRVLEAIAAVGQNTFGRQQEVELTGKGYPQLQQALEAIKAKAEARRPWRFARLHRLLRRLTYALPMATQIKAWQVANGALRPVPGVPN